eukprot:1190891-Prorocentrum_minimum.AAC.5
MGRYNLPINSCKTCLLRKAKQRGGARGAAGEHGADGGIRGRGARGHIAQVGGQAGTSEGGGAAEGVLPLVAVFKAEHSATTPRPASGGVGPCTEIYCMGNQCCHSISNIPEYSPVPDPRYPVNSVQEGSDPPYNKCHTAKGPSPDLL